MKQFLLTFGREVLSPFSSPYFAIALIVILTIGAITAATLSHAIFNTTLAIISGLVLYKDTVVKQ